MTQITTNHLAQGTLLARSLTRRYAFALCLVAVLVTAAWVSLQWVIADQQDTASVVNISGRQRMLSQRTALLARLLVASPPEQRAPVREQLEQALALFTKSHKGLLHGDPALGLPNHMSDAVRALYFDGAQPLNAQVQRYIDWVQQLLALPEAQLDPRMPLLQDITETALGPLVRSLDAVVLQYQREGEASVARLAAAETAFWLLTLLLLVAEALLIFHPFVRYSRQSMEQLHALHAALQQQSESLERTVQERTHELQAQSQALAHSEEKFRLISTAANDAIVIIGARETVEYWNPAAQNMFGYAPDEVVGRSVSEFLDAPELLQAARDHFQTLSRQGLVNRFTGQTMELQARRKGGEEFPVELSLSAMQMDGRWHAVGIVRDISERRRAELDLRIAATAFESQEGIVVTDAQARILRVNSAFTRITGYASEEVRGKTPAVLRSGRQPPDFYAGMWAELAETGNWEGEIWNRRKNGEIYPEFLSISAVRDDAGQVTNYVAMFSDITVSKAAADQIENLAFYDPLTLLPNRRLLRDRLQQALAFCARQGRFGALLFIDLDNFKTLNDTRGHDKGDLLLQHVAQRLAACVRKRDTVSRLGGDEFVVVLEDLSSVMLEAANQAEGIAAKVLESLGHPYQLGDVVHRNTPSIGVVLFDGRSQGIEELLKQADIAMYQAKNAGRNAIRFFDARMQAGLNERVELEQEMRLALEAHDFVLHFQPQVDTQGRIQGAEALVRWQHRQRGLLGPGVFIGLAEDSGLILPLGQWVLEQACAQLAQWQLNPSRQHLYLAVNVSAKQFRQADFVEQVRSAITQHGIDPSLLELELTESMLLHDVPATISRMQALRQLGVRFSLDDFGTGYSSLQYLKRLPLDQLKIDQSFVHDLVRSDSDDAIVTAIIDLARSLRLSVIAEGVETQAQRDHLYRLGCPFFQGYLFGAPVPMDQFQALLPA